MIRNLNEIMEEYTKNEEEPTLELQAVAVQEERLEERVEIEQQPAEEREKEEYRR